MVNYNHLEKGSNNFYEQDLAVKKTWYASVAEAYHRTRPTYHPELINQVKEKTQISEDSVILEIGCGPGTATIELAKLGCSIVALEPNYSAYKIAQKNLEKYSKVNIINTAFEEWQLNANKFDAVIAATSFHWLDLDIALPKIAKALKDEGSLILLWNTPPQPEIAITKDIKNIYQQYAPSISLDTSLDMHRTTLNQLAEKIIISGLFTEFITQEYIRYRDYTIDNYLDLLSTLSPYIALEDKQRHLLFQELKQIWGITNLKTTYLSLYQIAKIKKIT